MTINEHLTEYAGLPAFTFDESTPTEGLPDAAAVAWRVRTEEWDASGEWERMFERFLSTVDTACVTHLIIGHWGHLQRDGSGYPPGSLAKAADRFPALRHVFVGDIVLEEKEVSWIEHGDLSPLPAAFPALERLDVRGSERLRLEPFTGANLRTLRFETGGLPREVVHTVMASDLPNLEHLDLWLGTDTYGGDVGVGDLEPILTGERLPSLRHLGLENAEIQDEVAAAVAGAPVVARLESLSLALGALTDRGAEALLSGQPLTHLRRLDLHHHYLGDAMMDRLRAALPGVEVDLSEGHGPRDDGGHYIAVSE
ncbi:STM4015 family protein [Actinomadura kijaniata]|uniref:STM4015 family protein n=1 Tax=Actinomadura kijaniata TaxID=46161 RepID=UPI00082F6019|nr:STM4015 family protein [Actinomadura kijaniata]